MRSAASTRNFIDSGSMTLRQLPGVEAPAPEPCSIRIGKPLPPSQQWIVVPSNGMSDSCSAIFIAFAFGRRQSGFPSLQSLGAVRAEKRRAASLLSHPALPERKVVKDLYSPERPSRL